ncbi:MAG: Soluble epoxide hydrolase [Acidimicrobiales bacterium]|nr:Soluble epoxide hydrolase [Acidimicrobiales bacterium]
MSRQQLEMPALDGVRHHRIVLDGVDVHVADIGSGPPLVLLHGWPQHWFCWRHVVPLIAGEHRLIIPDLRGHGWSSAPQSGYEKEQLVTDLLGTLDQLGIERFGMVGHDWGGWVGFLAALRTPERITGLLALGIVYPFQHFSMARLLQAWRGAYQLVLATPLLAEALLCSSPRVVANVIRAGTRVPEAVPHGIALDYGRALQDPARARASSLMYRTFLTHEIGRTPRQRTLTVGTRLLIGEHDPIRSDAFMHGWEGHATAMTVEVLPGIGHFVPEEAPDIVADAVRSMFAETHRVRRGRP